MVIADCPPEIVVADLHTPDVGCASLESDCSLSTCRVCTLALHSNILKVYTVMLSQCISRTVNESGLSSTTLDIVQPDLTNTSGKARIESHST